MSSLNCELACARSEIERQQKVSEYRMEISFLVVLARKFTFKIFSSDCPKILSKFTFNG